MPVLKKARLIPSKYLVNQSEAIDALKILDLGFKIFNKENQDKLNYEINTFQNTYHHSYSHTLNKMRDLLSSIVEDIKAVSPPEVYQRYVESFLSTFDKKPLKVSTLEKDRWVFKEYVYDVKGHYSDEQTRLLILEDFDKERRYFEKLKAKFDEDQTSENSFERPRIPENVRIEVWRRDSGKCARCGSREKLEYDHIVPISKGGSNTARNIELLCEKHNRSKSNNVV